MAPVGILVFVFRLRWLVLTPSSPLVNMVAIGVRAKVAADHDAVDRGWRVTAVYGGFVLGSICLLGLFLNRDAEPYLNAEPDGNAELYRRLSVESFASEVLRKVLHRPPVKSCARRDRYFGECTSESTIGGRWMTPEKCARYAPLFGPRSQYKFKEPACPWRQGDRVSKACQYYCYYTNPNPTTRTRTRT